MVVRWLAARDPRRRTRRRPPTRSTSHDVRSSTVSQPDLIPRLLYLWMYHGKDGQAWSPAYFFLIVGLLLRSGMNFHDWPPCGEVACVIFLKIFHLIPPGASCVAARMSSLSRRKYSTCLAI